MLFYITVQDIFAKVQNPLKVYTVDNKQNLEEENLVTLNIKGQRWWPRLIEIKFGIAKVDSF